MEQTERLLWRALEWLIEDDETTTVVEVVTDEVIVAVDAEDIVGIREGVAEVMAAAEVDTGIEQRLVDFTLQADDSNEIVVLLNYSGV